MEKLASIKAAAAASAAPQMRPKATSFGVGNKLASAKASSKIRR